MSANFQIAQFPENKKSMVAFTFDDGTIDHYLFAAPELEKRLWHGTFFINPQCNDRPRTKIMSWEQIRDLAQRGHDIGNHTMSHQNLTFAQVQKDWRTLAWEIGETQTVLTERTGKRPFSYASAGINGTPEMMQRLLNENFLTATPPRRYIGAKTSPEAFDAVKKIAGQEGMFTVLMFHGVAPGYGGWDPLPSVEYFRQMLDDFKAMEDNVAFGSFREMEEYRQRAAAAEFVTLDEHNTLLSLPKEFARLNGPLYLVVDNYTARIAVNGVPVIPQEIQHTIVVWPGSVITVLD